MRPTWRVAARFAAPLALTLAGVSGVSAQDVPGLPDPDEPVHAEFRVFDGTSEITGAVRLRVMRSGVRGVDVIDLPGPSAELPPALYDVQALHESAGGVVAIKWAERLAVMHYPDEGGRHLEVINLRAGFGALQLRAAEGPLDTSGVTLFPAGDADAPVGQAIAGDDYVLFVVPAGRYDVRFERAEPGGASDTYWIIDVDVPLDRTRLKLVEPGGR